MPTSELNVLVFCTSENLIINHKFEAYINTRYIHIQVHVPSSKYDVPNHLSVYLAVALDFLLLKMLIGFFLFKIICGWYLEFNRKKKTDEEIIIISITEKFSIEIES